MHIKSQAHLLWDRLPGNLGVMPFHPLAICLNNHECWVGVGVGQNLEMQILEHLRSGTFPRELCRRFYSCFMKKGRSNGFF